LLIALDATYSVGDALSGVGVYSKHILAGVAASHAESRFLFCYRPHRYGRVLGQKLPSNCARFLLHDRFHVPSRADIFHGLNQRLPEKRMKRAVSTFHDLFVMTGEYSTPEFRSRFSEQARQAAERSDLIITVSQFTADQAAALLNVERSRLRVVHHGVDWPTATAAVPRENIVLNVGAIQERKNTSRLVEAFERMPRDWRLVLAGSSGFGAARILERIRGSGARDRIDVTGYLTEEDLERLYARASIFAFPSLDEGFGMPVLEAMARGVPVIASNRSALPEVAGDAALLIDPIDTQALGTAMQRLIDPHERDALTQKGLLRAAEFTWNSTAEKTWAVYRELV
jgi:glycosyltransferase involved in cell wall biosynthesis